MAFFSIFIYVIYFIFKFNNQSDLTNKSSANDIETDQKLKGLNKKPEQSASTNNKVSTVNQQQPQQHQHHFSLPELQQ